MDFTNFVSTSNEVVSDVVTVDTSHPLLWMTSIHEFP